MGFESFDPQSSNEQSEKIDFADLMNECLRQSSEIIVRPEDKNEKGQLLVTPEGKVSNLSEERWKIVRTPAFKAWFGDWQNELNDSSRVVDQNGEPLLVIHRGNGGITEFKTKGKYNSFFMNALTGNYRFGGAYFTTDQEYQRPRSVPYYVFLNLKNPYIVNGRVNLFSSKDKVYNNNPLGIVTDKITMANREVLEASGYDGVIENPKESTDFQLGKSKNQIIALYPEQVFITPSQEGELREAEEIDK